MANTKAGQLSSGELKEIFKATSGQSASVAEKMASTFKALADKADWSESSPEESSTNPPDEVGANAEVHEREIGSLALHHDVHVHLPATSDVSVYRAIFQALREEMM